MKTQGSFATSKTFTEAKPKKYTLPEIPEGLAPYWQFGRDVDSGLESTICVLVRADGPRNNKLPSTVTQWETIAVGVAFKKWDDLDNLELAKVISLGRAIKAFRNRAVRIGYVANAPIPSGNIVYTVL